MCTIIAAVGVWPETPLVIAANRDELLDRPAAAPKLWTAGALSARRVLAPQDLIAGGTWLGLNDAGLFVGITNRRAANIDAGRRTRGELPLMALAAGSQAQAHAHMLELDAGAYNPFHLLLADRRGASIVWGDGQRLHEITLGTGVHAINERSFGAGHSARHRTLAALAHSLPSGPPPTAARWRSILADHEPHGAPDSSKIGLDAMCVHAAPLNYGTRSSTLVELSRAHQAVRFMHAPGRPCETDFIDHRAEVQGLFAAPELE